MEQPIPTVISTVRSRPKHRKWFYSHSLVKQSVNEMFLTSPLPFPPTSTVSASTLRNSKMFTRGSTNGEAKPNGATSKKLLSRSHSDSSVTAQADASSSGARPKLSDPRCEESS